MKESLQSIQRLQAFKNEDIDLIIAPYGFGGTDNLAQEGAHSLVENDLARRIEACGSNVNTIDPPRIGPFQIQEEKERIRNIESIVQVNTWLADRVKQSKEENKIPITLGGDSSLCIASLSGVSSAQSNKADSVGVLWLNNHFCNSSPEVTRSWNANRMAFSALSFSGDLNSLHEDFASLIKCSMSKKNSKDWQAIIPKENIIHLGVSHKSAQASVNHNYFSMEDIEELGAKASIQAAIHALDHCEKIHVVLDVNAFNISGVSNFSLGQLNYREALSIAREIDINVRRKNRLSSIDIVEHCPSREAWDKIGETAQWLTSMVANIFGENIFNCLRTY